MRCLFPLWLAPLTLASSCNLGGSVDLGDGGAEEGGDGAVADGSSDGVAANDGSGEEGEGEEAHGGPLTFITTRFDVLSERSCDFDGDGQGDNAIADLGQPTADLVGIGLSTLFRPYIEEGTLTLLLHVPWVDDVTVPNDPEINALLIDGRDVDFPRDPSDDFSGEEPFYADPVSLDACGEPINALVGASLVDGVFEGQAETGYIPVFGATKTRDLRAKGTFFRGSAEAELDFCTYALASDLAAADALEEAGDDLTMLEMFLGGGTLFGLPSAPGITPDVDGDGDGLERFNLDDDGRILSCVDGDDTIIEGQDCALDERIADGISFTWRFVGIPALFAGRPDGWEEQVEGVCENPPETSLFDPR